MNHLPLPIRLGRSLAHRLCGDRRAVTAVEYGLIMGLVVLGMLVGLNVLANGTTNLWGNISSKVASATNR